MNISSALRAAGFATCVAGVTAPVFAQSVLAPAPAAGVSRTPSEASVDATPGSAASVASALGSGLPLIRRGPIALRPHVQYRFLYTDGIEAGPGNPRDTSIQTISPGLLVEIGKNFVFDYTPTWTYYSNESFRDTFDQKASLSGQMARSRWSLAGSQSYESSHAMLVETGRQTRQEKHASSLAGAYQLGEHTTLESSVNRSVRYANALTEAPEWTTSDWLQYSFTERARYRFSQRLSLAGGVGFGQADVSVGDDMTFWQPEAQISWQPTPKLSLSAQGGIEYRQIRGNARTQLETPLYSAAFSYAPVPTTRLRLEATRVVSASYFANELTRSRGWSAGVEQRLLKHFYLDLKFATQLTEHLPVQQIASARREDRYRALSARLSTVVFHSGVISLVYHVGRNRSDVSQYDFVSHQIGFELSHRF